MANVDLNKYNDFKKSQPEKYRDLMRQLSKLGGYPVFFTGVLKNQKA
jgi:hypothetical protein